MLDGKTLYNYNLPRRVVTNAYTRELGTADKPLQDLRLIDFLHAKQANWSLRLVAHGKPTYFVMFRSRGDAIFASQLLKAIKDHSAVDINAILVQLNGGPLDLSDWKSRQTLIKNLIDKIVTFMQTLMPTDPSVDMLKRLEALERENARISHQVTEVTSLPHPQGSFPLCSVHRPTLQANPLASSCVVVASPCSKTTLPPQLRDRASPLG